MGDSHIEPEVPGSPVLGMVLSEFPALPRARRYSTFGVPCQTAQIPLRLGRGRPSSRSEQPTGKKASLFPACSLGERS
jgi:hypothetical protein